MQDHQPKRPNGGKKNLFGTGATKISKRRGPSKTEGEKGGSKRESKSARARATRKPEGGSLVVGSNRGGHCFDAYVGRVRQPALVEGRRGHRSIDIGAGKKGRKVE